MKTRSDSIIDGLPQNQKDAVEVWLFEENLSFKEVSERLWQDFSVRCGSSSVERYHNRRAPERALDKIAESAGKANAVVAKFRENPSETYEAVLKLVGQIAFEAALKKDSDPEVLFNFTKLLIAARDREIKREQLELDRERFEFKASEACLRHLPSLREIVGNKTLNQDAKIDAIRRKLFGVLPVEAEKAG